MKIIFLTIGIIIGITIMGIVNLLKNKRNKDICGTLEIDRFNSEAPYLRLLTECQVEDMAKKKIVKFRVDPYANFTRK